ncbi:MAG: diaminopimelate epimerase [Clostridiales bacterium]|nr:diaminopimelate epimerase [Clostridiales bacterium]
MNFVKMHGAGNDYIFVDCLHQTIDDMSALAVEMSDRHFGVGSDGVVYLYPSMVADIKMRMFNADGSEGAMCGNAVRCIGRFLSEKSDKREFTVETNSGLKTVTHIDSDIYSVDMGKPEIDEVRTIFVCGQSLKFTYVSMGNPHCVIFVDDVDSVDMRIGEEIEHHSYFPDGINVEFVEGKNENLKIRVWERGSGETLSCGTGACAAVAASVKCGICPIDTDITVSLRGGNLKVKYSRSLYLTGNAVKVYEGDYYDKVHFCDRRSCQRPR